MLMAVMVVATLWALPAIFWRGRRELLSCAAETVAPPSERAAIRHEVLRCAGAFFIARR